MVKYFEELEKKILRRGKKPLEELRHRFESVKKVKAHKPPQVLKKHYRKINLQMITLIVLCRYGQLEDFSVPLNSVYAIARRTAIPYSTVSQVLKKFHADGCVI